MLDKENQVRAYKELRKTGIYAPYSLVQSQLISTNGKSKGMAWLELIDTTVTYPSSLYASLNHINAISQVCNEASGSGDAMIEALEHATQPNEFIQLGIGWDVIQKTENEPPAEFALNICISDHDNVDAVERDLSALDITDVKSIMVEINTLLSAPAGEDGGAGGSVASVPDATIKRLETALAPNMVASESLSESSAALTLLAYRGNKAKVDAIAAFNCAVQVSVIGSITGSDSVMNDVIGSVVPEPVLNALRDK